MLARAREGTVIAMILAAGRGERLRPVTDKLPKALVEVRGRSLLEHHLDAIKAVGVDTVIINLGWLGEQIVDRIGSGSDCGLNVIYSPEGDNLLETGGGIYRALPMLGSEPFLVVNADIVSDMPMPEADFDEQTLGKLILVSTPPYKTHGDFDIVDDRVCNSESPQLTFSGVAIYRPEFFAGCSAGPFPLAPLLRTAADANQLAGDLYAGPWHDVGTVERLTALNRD
jgi:MurNAc alpha-1-phosphate uridylyltransferase